MGRYNSQKKARDFDQSARFRALLGRGHSRQFHPASASASRLKGANWHLWTRLICNDLRTVPPATAGHSHLAQTVLLGTAWVARSRNAASFESLGRSRRSPRCSSPQCGRQP